MVSAEDKIAGALYGMLSGDSLAFPLHWYYNNDVRKATRDAHYGGTLDRFYEIPESVRATHPNSGPAGKSYMGILVEKNDPAVMALIKPEHKPFWTVEGMHWNATLRKGQNTNTSEVAKLLIDSLLEHNGEYKPEDFADRYIDFFQKHRHNDLYFEGIHQGYFQQLAAGKGKLEAGKEGETCLSGHTLPLPLTLAWSKKAAGSRDALHAAVEKHIRFTHRSDEMVATNKLLTDLLLDLLAAESKDAAKALIVEASKKLDPKVDIVALAGEGKDDVDLFSGDKEKDGKPFSVQCYQAPPGVMFLAYKYFDDPKAALAANADLGGDNTDRGSLLGALIGAIHGKDAIPQEWRDGLVDEKRSDVHAFVDKFVKLATSA